MWSWFKSTRPTADQAWWKLIDRSTVEIPDDQTGELIELRPGRIGSNTARGLVLDFRYVDGDGTPTHRGLLCYRCYRFEGRLYVNGYCPFREAGRTFRIDRMSDVFDVTDGVQVPVADISAFFVPLLEQGTAEEVEVADEPDIPISSRSTVRKEAAAIDEYLFKAARRDCVAGLRIIESIIKSDGVRGEEERTLLRSYLESRLVLRGYDFDAGLPELLMRYAAELKPPANLSKAITEVVADRAYFKLVHETATAMGNVQGRQRPVVDDILFRLEAAGGEAGWL